MIRTTQPDEIKARSAISPRCFQISSLLRVIADAAVERVLHARLSWRE
jgi:hypothetical protein